MRTAVACFVLAAAIATPGIVLAATSSSGAPPRFNLSEAFTATGTVRAAAAQPVRLRMYDIGSGDKPPQIDPRLRSASNALVRAFARRGVKVTPLPAGKGTAVLFASSPPMATGCLTTIVIQTLDAPAFKTPACPSRGVGLAGGLKISYTPASISTTIELALGKLR